MVGSVVFHSCDFFARWWREKDAEAGKLEGSSDTLALQIRVFARSDTESVVPARNGAGMCHAENSLPSSAGSWVDLCGPEVPKLLVEDEVMSRAIGSRDSEAVPRSASALSRMRESFLANLRANKAGVKWKAVRSSRSVKYCGLVPHRSDLSQCLPFLLLQCTHLQYFVFS